MAVDRDVPLDELLDIAADAIEDGIDVLPIIRQAGAAAIWLQVLRPRSYAQPLLEDRRARLIRELRASLHERMEAAIASGKVGFATVRPGDRVDGGTVTSVAYTNGRWSVDVAVDIEDERPFGRVVEINADGTVLVEIFGTNAVPGIVVSRSVVVM